MQQIGVVGAGLMGAGIAQVAAQAGVQVCLCDLTEEILQRSMTKIRGSLERMKDREQLADAVEDVVGRIKPTTDLQHFSACDFVIEAIDEDDEKKKVLFQRLNEICRTDAILASNTSSLSITTLASASQRPDKVVGMHFFNPVPVMELVEIVHGLATSDETRKTAIDVADLLGKTSVVVSDTPGFLVNRIFIPLLVEAIYTYQENISSREDIDKAVQLGLRHPMGPLTLADFIGLDTLLSICEVYHQQFGDPKYRPPVLLRRYVAAGWLGRKSGRGFYDYSS